MKVYGIKNCNTVKKALDWLNDHNVPYEFHDFKKLGVSAEKLEEWASKVGWEPLLNKRGTTWKQLDPEVQKTAADKAGAFRIMQDKTSVIKRPVVEGAHGIILGFDEAEYRKQFG